MSYSNDSLDGIREFCEREGQPCEALNVCEALNKSRELLEDSLRIAEEWTETNLRDWRAQSPDDVSRHAIRLLQLFQRHLTNIRMSMP